MFQLTGPKPWMVAFNNTLVPMQKEELVPFYVHRFLEGFPRFTSIEGLGYGVGTICKVLPVGSPMTTYLIEKLANLCQVTLQSGDPKSVKSGLDLMRILASTILAVDHEVGLHVQIIQSACALST